MLKNYILLLITTVFITKGIAQTIPSYIPSNGLIGWWPFNGNANDESGKGNNGKVTTASLTLDRKGSANSAYSFNGNGSFIEVSSLINTDMCLNSFSFSFWVLRDRLTANQSYSESLISKGKNKLVISYDLGRTGQPDLNYNGFGFDTYGKNYGVYNGILPINKWAHIVCVKTANEFYYYIDNKKYVVPFNIDNQSVSDLKSTLFFGSGNYGGKLDDIAYYNRALTDQEVTALYTGVNECANFTASINSEGNTTVCKGNQVKLKTTSSANNTYQWYYYSQPIVGAKDSIYKADTSGAFSIKITNAKNCVAQSASINVSVLDIPLLNTYDQVFCDTGKVQLCVKSSYDTISWYDEANKSKLLYKGSCFQTSLTTSKTFLVQANNGSCTSSFMPISAIIKTSPIIAKSSDAALCEYGSAVISATPSNGIINWYSENIGGKMIGTGITYTTPPLYTSTTYYAEAVNDGCISKTRKPVNVSVNASYIQWSDTVVCYGSSVELKAPANTYSKTNYKIGEVGPAGGYIFYDQGSVINGWRYLEAAPNNIENSSWGCDNLSISTATSLAIGAGLTNTMAIATNCKELNIAAKRCLNYTLNGFDDWFLPSQNEFGQIYNNLIKNKIGGFEVGAIPSMGTLYWTSSQLTTPSGSHFCLECNGNFYQYSKIYALYVRPVRRFSSNTVTEPTTYLWSTGDTSQQINPKILKDSVFWVDITSKGNTCRKFVTIKLNKQAIQFEKISGELVSTVCTGQKLSPVEFKTSNVYNVSISSNSPKNFWSNLYNDQLSIYIGSMDLPGEYPFYITLKGACDSVNIYMKLITNPAPKANLLPGGTVYLCTGNTATLTAEGGSNYLWNTGATTASIEIAKGGSYYVKVTNEFGCEDWRDTYVTTIDKPYVRIDSLPTMLFKSNPSITLYGSPTGGIFEGVGVVASKFNPKTAGLGKKKIRYSYTSKEGCSNTITQFLYVVDSINSECTFVDTITVTNKVTTYDTLKVTKFDTITITNKVTTYDTVTVKNNVYDTVTITNKVTKYDTITLTDTVSILKINFKLTTGLQANKLASMSLYPNPTSDVLHIEVGDAKALEGYRYRIVDALGKEVYNELVKNAITEIPLKSLGAAGMYQFEVLDEQNVRIQVNKIVLQ
jgi:hypothetical protein